MSNHTTTAINLARVCRRAVASAAMLVTSLVFADDCVRPGFADTTLQRLVGKEAWRSEHFADIPGHPGLCAYALSWVSDKRDVQSRVNLYVASYVRESSRKTADIKLDWEVDLLWEPPEVRIDGAAFPIHPDRVSFAVRTRETSIASTVGDMREQFDLIVIGRDGALSRVLSMSSREESFPRNCSGNDCETEPISRKSIVIVQPSSARSWREISVRTSETRTPRRTTTPTTRWLPAVRYRWGAEGYEVKP